MLELPNNTPIGGIPVSPQVSGQTIREIAQMLIKAKKPVAIADDVGRYPAAFTALTELAEMLSMPVLDSGKFVSSLNFPTIHDLNLSGSNAEILGQSDLVLALEVNDLFGALHHGKGNNQSEDSLDAGTKVISIGMKGLQRNSLIQGYQWFQPVFLGLNASVDHTLPDLVEVCRTMLGDAQQEKWRRERRRQRCIKTYINRPLWFRDA